MREMPPSLLRRQRLPRELVAAIYDGSCVLFVGAGLSQVYAGLPNGRDLANRFGESLLGDATLTESKRNFLRSRLEHSDELDLASVARYYSQHSTGDPSVSGRARLLRSLSEDLDVRLSNDQLSDLSFLAKYPWRAIYTTNYDVVVEHVLDHARVSYHRISKNDDLIGLRPGLKFVKLHGSIDELFLDDDGLRLVLSDSDYPFFLEGRELLFDELRNDLTKYPFLFLGYGLRDEHFTRLIALLNQLVNLRRRTSYVLARLEDINPFDWEYRANEGLVTILGDLREFIADLEWAQEHLRSDSELQDLIDMSWQHDPLTYRRAAGELARRYFEDYTRRETNAADLLRRHIEEDFLKGASLLQEAVKPSAGSKRFSELLDRELHAISSHYIDLFIEVIVQQLPGQQTMVPLHWSTRSELALRSLPLIWRHLDQRPSAIGDDIYRASRRATTADALGRFILFCPDTALVQIACRTVATCFRQGASSTLLDEIENILSQMDEPYERGSHNNALGDDQELILRDERRPVVRALRALLEPLTENTAVQGIPRLRRALSPVRYMNPHVQWELLALGIAQRDVPTPELVENDPEEFLLRISTFIRGRSQHEVATFLDDLGPGMFNRGRCCVAPNPDALKPPAPLGSDR
jgi:hypothetical protein